MTAIAQHGIPTTYRGIRFRSRLEARWAAFFDAIGWRWEYEPFDLDGWIPDFVIRGKSPLLIEVGPCVTEDQLRDKAAKAMRQRDHVSLVVGVSPVMVRDEWAWPHNDELFSTCGLLVNEFAARTGVSYGPAILVHCDAGHLAVFGDADNGCTWPCGHHWAESFQPGQLLREHWSSAINATQWRP